MNLNKKMSFFIFLALFGPCFDAISQIKPKITVIFIVDQMAYSYIPKLRSNFKYGFKTLLDNGIVYTNAYHPHGMPATGTGHTALNTGAFAKDHGIIANRWVDAEGKKVYCDSDTPENAAVFSPDGFYDEGSSAKHIMVDGLSDQFALASQPLTPRQAISVSLKSRAAIATASKAGKAIWFDDKSGNFTSSLAYFQKLPDWLNKFNAEKNPALQPSITWESAYPLTSEAYNFADINFIKKPRLVGTTIQLQPASEENFGLFDKTPQANQLVLDLAQQAFDESQKANPNNELLLWVCLSSLDKLGHEYGSNSLETIDMIYHLDKQIEDFMNYIKSNVASEQDVLFAWSADHGVSPTIELLQEKGYTAARRIHTKNFRIGINKLIKEKYGIDGVVMRIKAPNFYFYQKKINAQPAKDRKNIMHDIKDYLLAQPGIKKVWTYDELANSTFTKNQKENFLKQQLFPGRSGQIIIQTYPYSMVTKWDAGTDHRTPYNYDIHVPLVIYQPGVREKKVINTNVWTLQFASTLADILKVGRPSASIQEALPGAE